MFYIGHDSYARVWRIEEKKNKSNDSTRLVGRISTSETDQNGEKRYSNWNATFVGRAREVAKDFKEGDFIVIKKCKITNTTYEKDGEKYSWLDVTIFDVEPNNRNNDSKNDNGEDEEKITKKSSKSKASAKSKKKDEEDISDDELPF